MNPKRGDHSWPEGPTQTVASTALVCARVDAVWYGSVGFEENTGVTPKNEEAFDLAGRQTDTGVPGIQGVPGIR